MRSIFSVQQKRTAQLVLAAACLGVYAPALYAPVDPQTGQGSRQIVFNMGTVIDEIETKIDAIAMDGIGTFTALDAIDAQVKTINSKVDVIDAELGLAQSTIEVVESKLDACCSTLNSKVDVLDTNVDALLLDTATIESKIDVIDTEVGLAQSTIEVVESKLDVCCATLNSKVDEIFVDFQETWTIIGNQDQQSSASGDFTNAADIDAAQLTVIEWLKTIYRQQRGF